MGGGVQLIGVVLFLLGLIAVIMALPMVMVPLGVEIALFLAVLPFWIVWKLRTDAQFRGGVDLMASPDSPVRFAVSWEQLVWPVIPFVVALICAFVVFFHSYAWIASAEVPGGGFFWYLTMIAAIAIIALVPVGAVLPFIHYFDRVLAAVTRLYLNAKFGHATALLSAVVSAEAKLQEQFEAVGVYAPMTAAELSREFLLNHVPARNARMRDELEDHLNILKVSLDELRKCAALREDAYAAFEHAKESVMRQGGPTLLAELDLAMHGLESDLLIDSFAERDWHKIRGMFELMISRLDTIRAAAERGDADVGDGARAAGAADEADQTPRSLEQAYKVLNVRPGASKEVMKKAVEALRLNWHPDRVSDPAERERCTVKIQNVNAAWDLITGRRAAEPDAG